MKEIYDLVNVFDREIEVLGVEGEKMIYALDQKSDRGNRTIIGQLDLEQGTDRQLLQLAGTRIYESFRSYGAVKDYFYAVSVQSDYKLRLQRIDTHSWQITDTFWLVPEGEILNIYPIHKEYLIVTDEAAATDELLNRLDDEDYDGKYYTLTYLYHLYTGEKWYLHEMLDRRLLTDAGLISEKESSSHILQLHCSRGQMTLEGKTNVIYTVPVSQFIEDVTKGQTPDFNITEEAPLPENSVEIVYSPDGKGIYQVTMADESHYRVQDLQNQERHFIYDMEYGDFTGIWQDGLAVTGFYQPEQLREDIVFREYTALHYVDEGRTELREGHVIFKGGKLFLLKSFLYL